MYMERGSGAHRRLENETALKWIELSLGRRVWPYCTWRAKVWTLQRMLGKHWKDLEHGKAYDYAALKTIKPNLSFTKCIP